MIDLDTQKLWNWQICKGKLGLTYAQFSAAITHEICLS